MEESTPILNILTAAHSLFSAIISLYILFLLYSPPILLRALFSPVLPITAALLLTLLRSGAGNRHNPDRIDDLPPPIQLIHDKSPAKNRFEETFVEWNVKAPLGVIYEVDEESNHSSDLDPAGEVRDFPSLSMCFPETDSDSGGSTDGDFPADWISDDDFAFVEIEVESFGAGMKGGGLEEEDNLIEIDIFTARSEVVIAGELGDPR